MSIFGKIKNGVTHAVNEAVGEINKVIDKPINEVTDHIIEPAINNVNELIEKAQKEAEGIINSAYNTSKDIIADAQKKVELNIDQIKISIIIEVIDFIIELKTKNIFLKIISAIVKAFRTEIIEEVKKKV